MFRFSIKSNGRNCELGIATLQWDRDQCGLCTYAIYKWNCTVWFALDHSRIKIHCFCLLIRSDTVLTWCDAMRCVVNIFSNWSSIIERIIFFFIASLIKWFAMQNKMKNHISPCALRTKRIYVLLKRVYVLITDSIQVYVIRWFSVYVLYMLRCYVCDIQGDLLSGMIQMRITKDQVYFKSENNERKKLFTQTNKKVI